MNARDVWRTVMSAPPRRLQQRLGAPFDPAAVAHLQPYLHWLAPLMHYQPPAPRP